MLKKENACVRGIEQFCTMNVPLQHFLPMAEKVSSREASRMNTLQQRLAAWSFFNLFLVACLGVLLRAYPFLDHFPLTYKNLLHGHSHFAFGGWVMPILLALILKMFPEQVQRVTFNHWRNLAVLLLVSAYGMLASFPLQGYKAMSIFFSTLS